MQEEDYTFVTLDSDETGLGDAVVVDVDEGGYLLNAVTIDDSLETADFITLSDDTVMLSDVDMVDMHSIDMDMDYTDISFLV